MKSYSPLEERLHAVSHGIGFVLGIPALVLLIAHGVLHGNSRHIVSFGIYGVSLLLLYGASSFYHGTNRPELKRRLKIFDHASIYVLIAGTYTPFTLVTLQGTLGWVIFGASWGLALTGILLKLFFTGRYDVFSTLMYVFMGWIIVFAIRPLMRVLPSEGLLWLVAGGVSYTIGAVIYCIKKIPFNHTVFHVFVLAGSSCHFMAVYFYVLPVP